jgi:hypothetical protein
METGARSGGPASPETPARMTQPQAQALRTLRGSTLLPASPLLQQALARQALHKLRGGAPVYPGVLYDGREVAALARRHRDQDLQLPRRDGAERACVERAISSLLGLVQQMEERWAHLRTLAQRAERQQ